MTQTKTSSNANYPDSQFQGIRFATVGSSDESLISQILNMGAELVDAGHPDLDWVIVESTSLSPNKLRQLLGEELVQQIAAGRVHLLENQSVQQWLDESSDVRRLYTLAMLADVLKVPVSTIRGWHRRGLIQPVNRISKLAYFDFDEVLVAKQLATLASLGVQPKAIKKSLEQMATWLPESDRSLSRVSLQVDGHRLLLRRAGRLIEPGGQQRIAFEDNEARKPDPDIRVYGADEDRFEADFTSMILPFKPASDDSPESGRHATSSSISMMQLAERLEEQGELHDAIAAYRSLHLAHGPTGETCLRLGELLYRTGNIRAASERYSVAVELDSRLVEARAALGCVLAELGDTELAIAAFQGALAEHPHYAEVHFQLARALQAEGLVDQAIAHWKRFLELEPNGIWADEARQELADLDS